jgi:phosphohistidine phosphatase
MKTLLIIRHAKSESAFTLNDFERPLNERGKKDAPVMSKRLIDKQISIDAFISSTAKRAKTTAALFCETMGGSENDLLLVNKLYHAAPEVFYAVIESADDACTTIAVFAHNPGITYFVNELTAVQIDNMPTCAVFAVSADIKHWKNFTTAKKKFLFFDYPKNS